MNTHNTPSLNSYFLNNENVELLWELVTDDDVCKGRYDPSSKQFKLFFLSYVQTFSNDSIHIGYKNLVDMNKGFITSIVHTIKHDLYNKEHSQSQSVERNKRFDSNNKQKPITSEEIQLERKTKFEMDYLNKRNEFQNAIHTNIPQTPNFKDDVNISPIVGMEELISQTISMRNFDIEEIKRAATNSNNTTTILNKPSIRSERNNNPQNFKYIKIDNTSISSLNGEFIELDSSTIASSSILSPKPQQYQKLQQQQQQPTYPKKISWLDTNNETSKPDNVFLKLKRIEPPTATTTVCENTNDSVVVVVTKMNSRLDEIDKKIDNLLELVRSLMLKNIPETETSNSSISSIL